MPKEEIASLDFQVIAAGRSKKELDIFYKEIVKEIEKAISATFTKAPNKEKLHLRSCQSSLARLTRIVGQETIWKIVAHTGLKPNAIF